LATIAYTNRFFPLDQNIPAPQYGINTEVTNPLLGGLPSISLSAFAALGNGANQPSLKLSDQALDFVATTFHDRRAGFDATTSSIQGDFMKAVCKFASLLFLLNIFGLDQGRSVSALPRSADEQPIMKADQLFVQALGAKDRAAATSRLDEQFEWTNIEGKRRTKAESLRDMASLNGNGQPDTETKAFNYGELGFVDGIQGDTRFLRVWVKRPAGWRLFNFIQTPMKPSAGLPKGGGPCDNPCKTLPYTATTEMDKAILDSWQKTKNDEWHPNSSDWALRVADEFVIINDHTARTKTERVVLLAKQQATGEAGAPGDPIHSIRIFDFGTNAAVMLSQHTPYHGGKPYYNVRIWVLRDGLWQLGVSQQTTIESAAPVPAVN
jgi:hypothetical protein